MISAADAKMAIPARRRAALLGGSALCSAAVLLAQVAQAQSLPAIPDTSHGSTVVFASGPMPAITHPNNNANALDVDLKSSRTVINWDSFHVGGSDVVTFNFKANADIVLNKSPTAVQVDAGGQVLGKVGSATGGNIWFYSPQGVVIAPGAIMTAGNFVFSRSAVALDAIFDAAFVDAATLDPLKFLREATDSLIQVDTLTTATSASINGSGDVVLTASGGDLLATTVLAAGKATVTADAGALEVGEIIANGGTATVGALAGKATVTTLSGSAGVSVVATGDISVTTASTAAGDIALQSDTGEAKLVTGTSARDILITGPTATLGTGTAGRDVRLTGVTTASVTTKATAGRDLKVTGPSVSVASGDATGEALITATGGTATVTGQVTAGDDVEVTATGAVLASGGSLTATGANAAGDAHVLARSTGSSVNVGSAATQGTGAAAGDVTIDAVTTATLGSGNDSARDIKVTGPSVSLGSSSAKGDIFVTAGAGTATVSGQVTAGDDVEVTATGAVLASGGSLTATGANASGDAHVLARSTGSSVSLGSGSTQGTGSAAGDVTVDAVTTAALGSGSDSARDIKVTGPSVSLGSSSAKRDIFVTASTGTATVGGQVTAGDDIEVTAPGAILAGAGLLTATGVGGSDDAHVLARSTGGSVDVGSATTQGAGATAGDVTIDAKTTASLGSGNSSRDLSFSADLASLGSGAAARDVLVTGVTSAALGNGDAGRDIKVNGPSASLGSASAKRDVFVTAGAGTASVTGQVTAGDDVEVTAPGAVLAGSGSLTSTGVGATDDAHVLVRSSTDAVTLGSAATQGTGAALGDVTIDAKTKATITGTVTSARDVQVLAQTGVDAKSSSLGAERDVSATTQAGALELGSVSAGDDVALRGPGLVSATGDVLAGQTHAAGDPDGDGVADALIGSRLVGHDVDVKAPTVALAGSVAAGRAPGGGETLGAAQLASNVLVVATAADPSPGVAALQVATGSGKTVSANQDINLHTESVSGTSIVAGGLAAGRDVAVHSPVGDISLGSALAGDDVVLRAPVGKIDVTGDLKAGREVPGVASADAPGAADDLNAAIPFKDFDGNPATIFSVVGFDVNLVAQSVRVGGTTVAGRQPSTTELENSGADTAGPVDASTSDVRIETLLSPTPVAGLAPDITLGKVIATRDLQIDSYKAVTTGDLMAGRDVAVLGRGGVTPGAAAGDHSASGVTIGSAHAGDDVVAYSIWGHAHVAGAVTSGAPFARLAPTNDRTIDGATEAADELAIYLRYFDLDDASNPYVLKGGVIQLLGQGVTVGGAMTAHGLDSDIRLRSSEGIEVSGKVDAGRDAVFQTDAGVGGSVKVGDVQARRDVVIDGAGVEATAGTTLTTTDGDVAVRSRDGKAITLAGIAAGDDAVVRGTSQVTITGAVSAGGGGDALGAGDALLGTSGKVVLAGLGFDLGGHDVDIKAGAVSAAGGLSATGTGSDVRVQAGGGIGLAGASAARDVLVDGGSAVATGQLTAERDVGVRSTGSGVGAAVSIGGASAGDDVVIRGNSGVTVTGALSAGGGADSTAGDQAGDLMFGAAKSKLGGDLDLVGKTVDVRSSGGAISVGGAVTAETDARFQTEAVTGGSVKVAGVTAGHEVLLDGSGVEATGTLKATDGDVAVRSRGGQAMTLAAISAGDDAVLRGTGRIAASGTITAGGKPSTLGLGDKLVADAGAMSVAGRTFGLNGGAVDVVGGSAELGGATATGDVRIQAGGVTLAGATAGGDLLIDSTASVTTGDLTAGGDVAVRATGGTLTVGNAHAGDDVVLRGAQGVKAGTLTAGTAEVNGAGDLLFAADPTAFNGSFDLQGGTVDVKSASGSAAIAGAEAGGDVRVQALGGEAGVSGAVSAGRDILLDGTSVAASGSLRAGGDVALYGRTGNVAVGSVTAGDDIVIRAAGSVTASDALTAGQGGDTVGAGDRLIDLAGGISLGGASFGLSGAAIDVRAAGITLAGLTAAGPIGNVRLQSTVGASFGTVSATGDILVDSVGDLTVGALSAGRDIALRSTAGSVTLASGTAGDDIVLRAAGRILVTGDLNAQGGSDAEGAGDALFDVDRTSLGTDFNLSGQTIDLKSGGGDITVQGRATAADDVRLQTASGSVASGGVDAGRDVLLDGAAVSAGDLRAGRDIALRARAGSVAVASASAGDDLVIRASGAVNVAGAASAQGGADGDGAGDRLFASEVTVLNGAFDLAGANVDIRAHGAIAAGGPVTAGRDARFQALGDAAVSLGAVTAGRDILADGASVRATGQLSAGSDVALRGRSGAVEVASISAGDDIAVRASGVFSASGALSSGSGSNTVGAADRLISAAEGGAIQRLVDPNAATGSIEGFTLATGDIDIRSGGALTVGGAMTAGGASSIHLQSAGKITLGAAIAGDTIFVRSADLDLGGAWRAKLARIETTAAGGLALGEGGAGAAGALALSSEKIGLIDAATLQLFAGDSSGTARGAGLSIGTLNIDTAKIKTALELYAGPAVDVRITGAFAPLAAGTNSTTVRIGSASTSGAWTPKSIKVIADNGGSIGFSTTTTGRTFSGVRAFGSVELNATTNILMGYQDFIDRLETTPAANVASVVRTFVATQTGGGPRMLVTAGSLTLRADGKIGQQNTAGLLLPTYTGIYLTGTAAGAAVGATPAPMLVLDRHTTGPVGTLATPEYIELYGAINNGTTVLTGESASLSRRVVLGVNHSATYRLNTCIVLQQGSCTPMNGQPNLSLAPDQLTAVNLVDRTSQAGVADPTVASATNEEIWKDQ